MNNQFYCHCQTYPNGQVVFCQYHKCSRNGCFNPSERVRTGRGSPTACHEHVCQSENCGAVSVIPKDTCGERQPGSKFCGEHTCRFRGCRRRTHARGRPFCWKHICSSPECPSGRLQGSLHCDAHCCTVMTPDGITRCDGPRMKESEFCEKHKCCSAGCVNARVSERYCGDHCCIFGYTDEDPVYTCDNERRKNRIFCSGHLCEWKGCAGYTEPDSVYCADHQCSVSGCVKGRGRGARACKDHHCRVERCTKTMFKGSAFCDDHRCYSETIKPKACRNAHVEGSYFCKDHKCKRPKCANHRDGKYHCADHSCAWSGCIKATEKDTNYCSEHTCHKTDCSNGFWSWGHYCKDHSCLWLLYRNETDDEVLCCKKRKTNSRGSWCKAHTCAEEDCPNSIKEGNDTHCELHAELRDERIRLDTMQLVVRSRESTMTTRRPDVDQSDYRYRAGYKDGLLDAFDHLCDRAGLGAKYKLMAGEQLEPDGQWGSNRITDLGEDYREEDEHASEAEKVVMDLSTAIMKLGEPVAN